MASGNDYQNIKIDGQHVHLGNTYANTNTGASGFSYSRQYYACFMCVQLKEYIGLSLHDFLQELFLTDPSEDLDKIRRLKGKRIEGTCEWLQGRVEFQQWTDGTGPQLLWLIGKPGIGKTVLSDFVVETLQRSEKVYLAYFFCSNQDDRRNSATAILRGILFQLLQRFPDFFYCVEKDYRIKQKSFIQNLDSLWRAVVRILKASESRNIDVCVLVDALDECDLSSRGEFLSLVEDVGSVTTAKFIITGRPEADIEDAINSVQQKRNGQVFSRSVRVDSAHINNDLSKFIDHRVQKLESAKKTWPQRLIEDIRRSLNDKAGGTFLWVSLVSEDIEKARTAQMAKKKLQTLPSDLSEVYWRILTSIGPEYVDVAAFVLQWVVASRRPMTPLELATAQAVQLEGCETVPSNDEVEELVDVYKACSSFVYYDAETDTINLVHQSAKDYLLGTDTDSVASSVHSVHSVQVPQQYRVELDKASAKIIEVCWTYVGMGKFKNRLFLPEDRSGTVSLEAQRRVRVPRRVVKLHAFLRYAIEELLDDGPTERPDVFHSFIAQRSNTDILHVPDLGNFWLVEFAQLGHQECVRALLNKGANVNISANSPGRHWYGQGTDTALYWAALGGFTEVCKVLIEKGADVNATSPLHAAAKRAHRETISLLLENGAMIDLEDRRGQTALQLAVDSEHDEAALLLLEKGADYSNTRRNVLGKTVLHVAAENGRVSVLKWLIRAKVDLHALTPDGCYNGRYSALALAVQHNHTEAARTLIEAGADVRWETQEHGQTLLHLAVRSGTVEMLRLVCESILATTSAAEGAESESSWFADGESRTAMITDASVLAAELGREDYFNYLATKGAAANGVDSCGLTALHRAASEGHDAMVQSLIRNHQADIEAKDYKGWSALHHACGKRNATTVSLLLSSGASQAVDSLTEEGETPLHLAVLRAIKRAEYNPGRAKWEQEADPKYRTSAMEVVNLLLKHGANAQAVLPASAWRGSGQTVLHLAVRASDAELVTLLSESSVNMDMDDMDGYTALHMAAAARNVGMVKLLLDLGSFIDAKDAAGRTPLHLVVSGVSEDSSTTPNTGQDMVELLLKQGASPHSVDHAGDSVFSSAISSHHRDVCMFLLQYGAKPPSLTVAQQYPNHQELLDLSTSWDADESEVPSGTMCLQPLSQPPGRFVDLLLEATAYTACMAEPSGQRLLEAAKHGYEAAVGLLLEISPGSSISLMDKDEALQAVAGTGHTGVARLLINAGAQINGHNEVVDEAASDTDRHSKRPQGRHNNPPLVIAVRNGKYQLARLFLDFGAQLDLADDSSYTPLAWAADTGDTNMVALLLDAGAHMDGCKDGPAPLAVAAYKGHEDVVTLLISRGAEIDHVSASARDSSSRSTALIEAILGKCLAVVRRLLAAGASIYKHCIIWPHGEKPSAWTLIEERNGWYDHENTWCGMLGAMLELSTDLTPTDRKYALQCLTRWSQESTHIKALLDRTPESLDIQGAGGQRLLTWAMERGFEDIVSRLLEMGVEEDIRTGKILDLGDYESDSGSDFDFYYNY